MKGIVYIATYFYLMSCLCILSYLSVYGNMNLSQLFWGGGNDSFTDQVIHVSSVFIVFNVHKIQAKLFVSCRKINILSLPAGQKE